LCLLTVGVLMFWHSLFMVFPSPSAFSLAHSDYRHVAIRHYATFEGGVAL
jgi:hypothetical protein